MIRLESKQFRLRFAANVKAAFLDRPAIRRAIGAANADSLNKAGMDIKQAAKKGIGSAAPKQTKSGMRAVRAGEVVEFQGGLYRDLTMLGSGKPRPPGKPIKSWSPRRFVYNDIRYFYDKRRGSVVIGPQKEPWLNRLHEFGGQLRMTAYRIGVGTARSAYLFRHGGRQGRDERGRFTTGADTRRRRDQYGSIIWAPRAFKGSRNWERTTITKVATYPARPFMQGAAGVQKKLRQIRERWKNALKRAA